MKLKTLAIFTLIPLIALAAPKKKPKAPVNTDALYERVEQALDAYDIDAADEAIDELETALTKAKRQDEARFQELSATKQLIENMLERVENIRIVDVRSINIDSLFKSADIPLPMSKSTGTWHGANWFDGMENIPHDSQSVAFIPASGREIFWSAPAGKSRTIWQAGFLLDGSLDSPHMVFDPKDFDGRIDLNTPFLAADGLTLYLSGEIPGASIGGHDIFRAIRSGAGEDFTVPANMGMPYSSTYYDGFFAIDPESELALFVTDRANPDEDNLNMFVFVPNETRVNRPADSEDPTRNLSVQDAIVPFIPGTWAKDSDRKKYLERLAQVSALQKNADSNSSVEANEEQVFQIYVPKAKKFYTSLKDFRTPAAAQAMKACLETQAALDDTLSQLHELYGKYSKTHSGSEKILGLEKTADQLRMRLRSQRNTAIRLESQSL